MVPHEMIRDTRLTPVAFTVLVLLLTWPPGHASSADDIARFRGLSLGAVERALRCLEECGYVVATSSSGGEQ